MTEIEDLVETMGEDAFTKVHVPDGKIALILVVDDQDNDQIIALPKSYILKLIEGSEIYSKGFARAWKKIINALSSIIDEVLIEINSGGIQFTAMDPSHISMVDFHMGKDQFEEYKVSGEISLGLTIDENRKIINRSKPDDMLTLTADQNKITYEFQPRDGKSVRKFKLPLIEVTLNEKYKVPQLKTTATIKLPSYVFEDSIKDAYIIADNVKFTATPDMFLAFAEGDSGNFLTEIKEWLDYEVTEQCESIFNLSYLTDIAKSIEDEVTLELGNDMPLKLSFTLDGAEILFILAPRVDKEE